MFDNQSKTESLLQLSVPQDPLLLHPFGAPPSVVEQFVHAIISIYSDCPLRTTFQNVFERKDIEFLLNLSNSIVEVYPK
jgi:hypothetical protein